MAIEGTIGPEEPVQLVPSAVFGGDRAMTIQDYISLNCKTGAQFEASSYVASLPSLGTVDYVVEVGALPILVKGRQIQFTGQGIRLELYKAPAYTGGTPAPYYNLNKWAPNVGLGVIRTGMSITDVGTQIGPSRDFIGSTAVGQSTISSVGEESPGLEIVLEPGAKYLFRSVNTSAVACRYSAYSTWYEGLIDVPQV